MHKRFEKMNFHAKVQMNIKSKYNFWQVINEIDGT